MVISRPREHLARGQFNSGWMITPSRSYCPFIFLRLPSSIRFATPPDPVRTRYTTRTRPCDFHSQLASFSKGRSLVAPPRRVGSFARLFVFFSPLVSQQLFSSNYFDGNCFSLVSILVYKTSRSLLTEAIKRRLQSILNWCYNPTNY